VVWPWDGRKGMLYGEGLTFALEEVNAAGGVNGRKLTLVRDDDRETVDEGRLVAQRFASNPDVVAVIGHLQSYVTGPAAAIYDLAGMLMIAPTSTDPDLTTHGYARLFRTIFTDRDVGRQMASLAASSGHRRAGIYYIRNSYGRGLANAFEEQALESGLAVADRQSYDANGGVARTLAPLLDDWKSREIDTVFLATEPDQASVFIAEARTRGFKAAFFGGDALGSPDLFKQGKSAADGTVVASPFHPDESRPEVRQFVTAFQRRFGKRPDAAAALAYDAVKMLAHAMIEARSTVPDRVAATLHAMSGWPGVTGSIAFTAGGDLKERPILRMVARNGQFTYVPDAVRSASASGGQ